MRIINYKFLDEDIIEVQFFNVDTQRKTAYLAKVGSRRLPRLAEVLSRLSETSQVEYDRRGDVYIVRVF